MQQLGKIVCNSSTVMYNRSTAIFSNWGKIIFNSVTEIYNRRIIQYNRNTIKGKADPLQAWSGPECSRKLSFPDFMTTAEGGGKVVSLMHRPPLPQEMLLVLISVRGCVHSRAKVRTEGFYVNEKSTDAT